MYEILKNKLNGGLKGWLSGLRAFVTLKEDLGFVVSTHMVTHNGLTPARGTTHAHMCKQIPIHTKINPKNNTKIIQMHS